MKMKHIQTTVSVIIVGVVMACYAQSDRYDKSAWKRKPPEESFDYTNGPMHPERAYRPGVYGKVKDAPMFICWREWDGEIRLGGVAKGLSGQWSDPDDFAIEIEGPSGCANWEHLLFSDTTTNVQIRTNYTGTIQLGSNYYKIKDILSAMTNR